jgi:hypothetical protein
MNAIFISDYGETTKPRILAIYRYLATSVNLGPEGGHSEFGELFHFPSPTHFVASVQYSTVFSRSFPRAIL